MIASKIKIKTEILFFICLYSILSQFLFRKVPNTSGIPVKEIQFDLSVGRVAAKWWGPTDRRPILCVHGWQDNAGSFDTLIPLLPRDLGYLAIDLPGHGLSSHYANGYYYHTSDVFFMMEEVRRVFNWPRLSLLAHSMGSLASFIYASTFPSNVDSVCALDTLKLLAPDPRVATPIFLTNWKKSFDVYHRSLDKNQKAPEYTYDELVERVHDGSYESVDHAAAKYLIQRGAKRSSTDPNKFYFARDIRWKYFQNAYVDHNVSFEMIKYIRAPYLFAKGDDKIFSESSKNIFEAVDAFRRHTPDFQMLKVDGTHHFHLNTPEVIADRVGEFLLGKHQRENASTEQAHILKQ